MRRHAVISYSRLNRAADADFEGDVPLTSKRHDKDSDGAGVSISLAVAGVVAAGLGLATMSFAFKPLPKPGVPVVISTAAPARLAASFQHVEPRTAPSREVSATEDAAPRRYVRPHRLAVAKPHASSEPIAQLQPKLIPVQAPAPAVVSKIPVQVAKADVPGEKLCKAPQPQVLSAKTLQAAMILRYDPRKVRPLDIPAPQPPSDDTERRLKLSALLGHMLDN